MYIHLNWHFASVPFFVLFHSRRSPHSFGYLNELLLNEVKIMSFVPLQLCLVKDCKGIFYHHV